MKLMIASDIHGSAVWCEKMLEAYRDEGADKLLLLGDILYHGPRNDLPEGYAPKKVIEMLNPMAEELLCVRGNCEAEVDQMVLKFPVMADYAVLCLNQRMIYATHGHKYGKDAPPPIKPGDLLLCGHTHIPAFETLENGILYVNPGSTSIPKAGSAHSYMILDDNILEWKDLSDRKTYRTEKL